MYRMSSSESATGSESEDEVQKFHKNAGPQAKESYLSPLTLAGEAFLETCLQYRKQYNTIDRELYRVLTNIVEAITYFLDQNPQQIHENEKLQLVKANIKENFGLLYICKICQHWLCDAESMAKHITMGHANQIKSKTSRRQRRRERNGQRSKQKKQEMEATKGLKNQFEKSCNIGPKNAEESSARASGGAQGGGARKKEKTKKQSGPLPLPKKIKSHLNHNYEAFFKESISEADVLMQIEEYDVIEKDLVEPLKISFKEEQLKIYKFGSRLCGIGTRNSDLDLFVAIGENWNVFENRGSKRTGDNIEKIKKSLVKHSTWGRVTAIKGARVPIIKAIHVPTGIECDIGVSNPLGFCNTELLKYLFDLQPLARNLAIYMKKWLMRSKLTDVITTYSINLIIVYYLQTKNHLPSIETLQKDMTEKAYVGPWICNFKSASLQELNLTQIAVNTKIFKQYLKEFFEFLGNFKYETYIISPYYGRPINFYNASTDMPEHYLEYVATQDADHRLLTDKPMVVQDPLQLNHNVTKGISKHVLMKLKDYLIGSANLIEID